MSPLFQNEDLQFEFGVAKTLRHAFCCGLLALSGLVFAFSPIVASAKTAGTTHRTGTGAAEVTGAVAVSGAVVANASAADSLKIELPVIKYQLKNGLTVLLHEDHSVPMISYHTWYRVGSRDEADGVTGAAHMLEHMMFKGAKKYTGQQFDQIMRENGIQHNAFTTYDYTGFYMNLPSAKLELIMDVEQDRMSSLKLDPKDLLSEREVVKEERRWRVDNNPSGLLRELTMGTVFRVHPYRWPVIGHMKDIAEYKAETLRHFYETFYVPNNAILVIAGDLDVTLTKKMIEKYYGGLVSKPLPPRALPTEPAQKVQYNAHLKKDVQGTTFTVAFQGVPQGSKDMYALDLASVLLGDGSSSRLNKRLVYEKKTALGASAHHSSLQDAGVFGVTVAMKPGADMQPALDVVYNEIYKLRAKNLTEDELRKGKTLAMKSLVDSLTTIDGRARALATAEIVTGSYENLLKDLEKYDAVTADEVRRVSNEYLNQTQRSIVVLDSKAAKEDGVTQ